MKMLEGHVYIIISLNWRGRNKDDDTVYVRTHVTCFDSWSKRFGSFQPYLIDMLLPSLISIRLLFAAVLGWILVIQIDNQIFAFDHTIVQPTSCELRLVFKSKIIIYNKLSADI